MHSTKETPKMRPISDYLKDLKHPKELIKVVQESEQLPVKPVIRRMEFLDHDGLVEMLYAFFDRLTIHELRYAVVKMGDEVERRMFTDNYDDRVA